MNTYKTPSTALVQVALEWPHILSSCCRSNTSPQPVLQLTVSCLARRERGLPSRRNPVSTQGLCGFEPRGWAKALQEQLLAVILSSSSKTNTNLGGHMTLATGPSLVRSPKAKQLSKFCGSGHRPKFTWNSPASREPSSCLRSPQGRKKRFLWKGRAGDTAHVL